MEKCSRGSCGKTVAPIFFSVFPFMSTGVICQATPHEAKAALGTVLTNTV